MKTTLKVVCLMVMISVPSGIFCQDVFGNVMHFNGLPVFKGSALELNPFPDRLVLSLGNDAVPCEDASYASSAMRMQSLRSVKGQASGTKVNLSFLGGGVIHNGFQWGGGLEFGVTIIRWIYIGGFASTQFTENVNNSFVGGDLGYNADLGEFAVRPFVNLGACISTGLESGHSNTEFYVGAGLAVTLWLTPKLGVGPDLRYLYIPDHESDYGGMYWAFVILF